MKSELNQRALKLAKNAVIEQIAKPMLKSIGVSLSLKEWVHYNEIRLDCLIDLLEASKEDPKMLTRYKMLNPSSLYPQTRENITENKLREGLDDELDGLI